MTDAIITFVVCLAAYRLVCGYFNVSPWSVVQITFHNYNRRDDD